MIRSVVPFGDGAVLVDLDEVTSAHQLADRIEEERDAGVAPEGVGEAVVGYGTVVVHVTPGRAAPETLAAWLAAVADGIGSRDAVSPGESARIEEARRVVIPASFDGPDLAAVADALGTSARSVIGALCGTDLEVAFLGFAPGFPYLVGLPLGLASIPRRPSPRSSVPAGSVAVGGGFASVYPQDTPGGWMLLGATTLPLFDRNRPPYALLQPGDIVRFEEVDEPPVPPSRDRSAPGPRPPLTHQGPRFVEVLEPGLLSLIEDGGRPVGAALGVPRAGPADPEALCLANRLMGNPDGYAALEVTAAGPALRFHADAHVTVVGAGTMAVDLLVDGHPVDSDTVVPVGSGQVVAVGRVRSGLRAYLAVSGGFDSPVEIGSRSSDVLCGLGPGPLRAGDRLDLFPPARPRGRLSRDRPAPDVGDLREARVLAGPHRLDPASYDQLCAATWRVGESSNRIGIRLLPGPGGRSEPGGNGDADATAGAIPSTGMVTGAVQLPPDGNPIVLMPDHATVGGYPVVCCVITADLPVLGQLRPGDTLRLVDVDAAAARQAWDRWERSLDDRISGWYPTATAT
jgi:KipI family sensor histidine kinase inhibitor